MAVVTIVGAGVIGVSWARLFGAAGWEVRVSDPRPDLQDLVAEQLAGLPVTATDDLAAAASGTDFVQEAGPERIPVKEQMFATLAASTRDDVVLASSSSSLLPSVIAEGNPAADRIVIGHPFNPPELMPLVEVVPGPRTSTGTVDRAVEVYRSLGKLPITLKKEVPGFVGNRLQKAFNDQATYLVQQGVIDPEDPRRPGQGVARPAVGHHRTVREQCPRRRSGGDAAPRRARRGGDDLRDGRAGPVRDGHGHRLGRTGLRHRGRELPAPRRDTGPAHPGDPGAAGLAGAPGRHRVKGSAGPSVS